MTLEGNPDLVDPGFDTPPAEPTPLLEHWLAAAEAVGVSEPRSLTLATANAAGRCSIRVLLLKEIEPDGIVFCSQEESTKGRELAENPWAAGNLWWRETVQQVSFAGTVDKTDPQVADRYFAARNRSARAIAIVSRQSRPMDDEQALRDRVAELVDSDIELPRPANWWAYRLQPAWMEFWHGSPDRFHRRLLYRRASDGVWTKEWLQP